MLRRARLPIALLTLATVMVACTDRPAPTAPLSMYRSDASAATGTCTTIAQLTTAVNQVFGAGSPDANSALGKLSNVDKKLKRNDIAGAQDAARNLIRYIQEKAASLPGVQYVPQLIASLECYVGITDDTFLVFPSDQPQELISDNGTAGILLPANPVSEPTLITITILPDTTTGLLDTKLDKYPGFIRITQQSGVVNSLIDSVVVGVCPSATVPGSVLGRLRLGHQASAGFEVTPAADASFLNCSAAVASADGDKLPGWVRSLTGLVLPKTLYAQMEFGGGVGGTVTEFSPFGPVDPELSFGGGVGGTVTEFIRVPAPTPASPMSPSTKGRKTVESSTKSRSGGQAVVLSSGLLASLTSPADCLQGVVGTALPAECRPLVTITTANGTILQNVPVSFSIELGGGSTAIDDPATRTCGVLGNLASTTTNVNGKAGACWTLGAEAGANTLIATASAGGDAPTGVYFTPNSNTFTVTALKASASLSLSGLNQTYTGSPLAVTVTSTPLGLSTVNVTYNGSASAPTDAGSYPVLATLVNPSFQATTMGTFVIGQAAQSALVVNGPASATFGDAAVQLGTSGGSGTGSITFSAGTSAACSVTSGGLFTITGGTGTCAVTATKAADSNYESVTSAPISVSPAKAAASITLTGLAYTYDGTGRSATATTTPANTTGVSISYDGATTLPMNAGSYAVLATLSNNDYSATDVSGTLVIAQAGQATLSITGPNGITFGGGSVALGTTGGSGTGTLTFNAGASTGCVVTAAGSVTTTSGTGSCDVTAAKASDVNYLPATSGVFSLSVSKATATLTLGGLSATYDGSPKSATATSSPVVPGISVTYDGATTAPRNAGSYAVVATLTNADYEATPASGTLVIVRGGQAALTITAPATATYGAGTVQLSANGGSGTGSVTFSSLSAAACSVEPTTGVTSILTGIGNCVVSAAKASDSNYDAITAASASIVLNRSSQSLDFATLPGRTYGDAAFTVSATASSGQAVTFSTVAGSNCAVTGSTVSLTGAGSCAVLATQAGDGALYSAAAPVTQSFGIAKRVATATAGSGTDTLGGTISLPCSVSGLLSGDVGAVTCTTSLPSTITGGSFPTTPVVSPTNPANYAVTSVLGTLNVRYVQQGCFAEPIKSVAIPPTTSGITKGATVQVRCTLLDAAGRVVSNAKGNLLVEDYTTGAQVLAVTDAFRLSSGTYTYKLSTSGSGFVKGNFYRVTSTWNDGSTTVGWFYLNK